MVSKTFILFVVLAATAAFFGTTVHHVSLQWTAIAVQSLHRVEGFGGTSHLGLSTCLVVF